MTYIDALSKLSTTLDHFNSTLDSTNKLDKEVLRTIQNYLTDSTVTLLKPEDERKIQRPLKQLELLNDQATLDRVKSIDMKEINRQVARLAQMINRKPEQTKKNACFTIIKLEVCFLKILSEEAVAASKKWRNLYEEKMNMRAASGSSGSTPYARAKRTDKQQCVVNELMNAALLDVIVYFEKKGESFTDRFTEEFLDLLQQKIENPGQSVEDKAIADVEEILTKTAKNCQLPIDYVILQLRYAIIEIDERVNPYSIPLLQYITDTKSATLEGFNNTLAFSAALSSEDVKKFEPLFKLYCEHLLPPQNEESSSAVTIEVAIATPKKSKKSDLPPPPPIKGEDNMTFIWITPFDKDQHKEYLTLLKPLDSKLNIISPDDLETKISKEFLDSRIFLCMNATQTHDLLSSIHEKPQLYLVYVLCRNQAEVEEIEIETEKFNKVRIVTSNKKEFIQQFALDTLPSYIEVADIHFNSDKTNARRFYRSTISKINDYGDDLMKHDLIPILEEKIKQCYERS